MNRTEKIALYILTVAVLVILVNSLFFSGRNLKKAIEKLDAAEKKINSAILQIDTAKASLDSIQVDLNRFRSYVMDIQGRVEILDLERRLNEVKFAAKRDSIRIRLKELYRDIELIGQELPEIPVVSIHN